MCVCLSLCVLNYVCVCNYVVGQTAEESDIIKLTQRLINSIADKDYQEYMYVWANQYIQCQYVYSMYIDAHIQTYVHRYRVECIKPEWLSGGQNDFLFCLCYMVLHKYIQCRSKRSRSIVPWPVTSSPFFSQISFKPTVLNQSSRPHPHFMHDLRRYPF